MVPKLEKQVRNTLQDAALADQLYQSTIMSLESDLSIQKGKKWFWGIIGIVIGAIGSVVTIIAL